MSDPGVLGGVTFWQRLLRRYQVPFLPMSSEWLSSEGEDGEDYALLKGSRELRQYCPRSPACSMRVITVWGLNKRMSFVWCPGFHHTRTQGLSSPELLRPSDDSAFEFVRTTDYVLWPGPIMACWPPGKWSREPGLMRQHLSACPECRSV